MIMLVTVKYLFEYDWPLFDYLACFGTILVIRQVFLLISMC